MQFIYKIPGYILCLLAGFCLSFGGALFRSFEGASPWQILFWRSLFFTLALIVFLVLAYRKEALSIIKKSGFFGILGGFFLSTSFVGYNFAKSFAWSLNKPFYPIDHMVGHLVAPILINKDL